MDVRITRNSLSAPYDVQMVYSYKGIVYLGAPPFETVGVVFPKLGDETYRHFFSIHNGFSREGEIGIFPYRYLAQAQYLLREDLLSRGKISLEDNCSSLGIFPFYAQYDIADSRCFIIDAKIRQYFPSYNVRLDNQSLFPHGKIAISEMLSDSHYHTFLLWLEQYLLSQKP
ncbi:putative cytosolic protein [Chlamydia trachomatis]|nr:putative cytosolic protein [Chlamydia trachomatis]